MNFNRNWIPLDKIETFIQFEPLLVIVGLAALSWFFYRLFLKNLNEERHRSLQAGFQNLAIHVAILLILTSTFFSIQHFGDPNLVSAKINGYIGLFALFSGALVFIKTWRLLAFEYLFFGHMKVGVPVLLVNLFTLLLSIVLYSWIASEIFSVRVTPLLATSAVFSLVLGLALQDTLGNLFAGIALQLDKPYEIGDWVEIQTAGSRWIGMVNEISWRATVLIGVGRETLVIPNRVAAQAEILNFAAKQRPFFRRDAFKLPHDADFEVASKALIDATVGIDGIVDDPAPIVLLVEITESWMLVRLVYSLVDYGKQWVVTSLVQKQALKNLAQVGIKPAMQKVEIHDAHKLL